jgi:hypothetical protein
MTPTKDENDLRECEGGREGSFFFSQQLLGSKHFFPSLHWALLNLAWVWVAELE